MNKNDFSLVLQKLKQKDTLLFIALFVVGVLVRVVCFGIVPGGLNQDEAFAGYEAYSLLHYGKDSAGYAFPCYFVSWGSGMNVLESYLAIPFVGLFGLSAVTIRLPQLLVGCISLPVVYLLLKDIFNKTTAFWGMGFMAVCPWHIMLSRWGLESNLAPGFLLFGLYFLIKGLKNNKLLLLSALMYGTALYAYATTWAVVPLTLLVVAVYLYFKGHKISLKWTLAAVLLLFLLALPLLLFYLVNQGVISEIKTAFFSAPKLLYMRESEISLKNLVLPEAYEKVFNLVVKQEDGLPWNTPGTFGMFYRWTIPFAVIGLARLLYAIIKREKNKAADPKVILFIGLVCAFMICVMISGLNINKANMLHMYVLLLIAIGLEQTSALLLNRPAFKCALVAGLALCFCWFSSFYFGMYNKTISVDFKSGLGEAVTFAKTLETHEICVDPSIYHSQILFYDKTPLPEYLKTVEFKNYPSAYLQAKSFGNYFFNVDYSALDTQKAYIVPVQNVNYFTQNGYAVETFENYIVAYF